MTSDLKLAALTIVTTPRFIISGNFVFAPFTRCGRRGTFDLFYRPGFDGESAAAAETDRFGHRLAQPGTEDLQPGCAAPVVIEPRDRPSGQDDLLAELASQFPAQGTVVERGLGQRGGRVRLAHPWGREGRGSDMPSPDGSGWFAGSW